MTLALAALYGKSYIPAAKDAWRLLKHRGIDALVNDNLISISESHSITAISPHALTKEYDPNSLDFRCLYRRSSDGSICLLVLALHGSGLQQERRVSLFRRKSDCKRI
jgi:hypothetical protein